MKKLDISQVTEYSRKEMIHKILDLRDQVIDTGTEEAKAFKQDWESSAPVKTGFTRQALSLHHDPPKYLTRVTLQDYRPDGFPEPYLVNILNKNGKTRRFKDRLINRHKREFYKKVNNSIKKG